MADISTELQAIMNAVYGEDVRGAIHDAIDLINKVGEVTLTLGTAVTSASSSTEGFYEDSVYINTNTNDVWQCTGLAWALKGNIKGDTGATGFSPYITVTPIVGGHQVQVTNEDTGSIFNVMDGAHAVYFDDDALVIT